MREGGLWPMAPLPLVLALVYNMDLIVANAPKVRGDPKDAPP